MMLAALLSKSGSLLAKYRSSRCGCNCAWARIRWTVDLLSANSLASFRQDQCVLPSPGFCCTRRITRACTFGVAARAGKFDDAVATLKETFDAKGRQPVKEKQIVSGVGNQTFVDEIRWDLAQAYVCASAKNGSFKQRYALAKDNLELIRQHESSRVDQRFSGELELSELQENCKTLSMAATAR